MEEVRSHIIYNKNLVRSVELDGVNLPRVRTSDIPVDVWKCEELEESYDG